MKNIFLLCSLLLLLSFGAYSQNKLTENFRTNEDTTTIIVNVVVDGKKLNFIFDSGAQISMLFDDGSFNLEKAREVKVIDANDKPTKALIIRKKIAIPSLKIKNKGYCLVMKNIPQALKELNIHGIIGADIINRCDWEINFKNLEISRLKKKFSLPKDSFYEINTHIDKTTHGTSTYIIIDNDTIPFLIDTGSNLILTAYKPNSDLQTSNLKLKVFAYSFTISSNYLEDTSFIGLENITIGDFQIKDIPVSYYMNKGTTNSIGTKFFKPFGRFYMLNSKNKILIPTIKSYQYGFESIRERDGIIVSQRIPIDSNVPSYLGKKTNEIKGINKKEYKISQTRYSFKSINENNMPVHNSK
jgi:predicted aspartyl protease